MRGKHLNPSDIGTKQFDEVPFSPDGGPEYLLVDEAGILVRVSNDPRKLSVWAFDNGADSVRHEYDLIKAEGIPWTR